jgi:hypothetical protein
MYAKHRSARWHRVCRTSRAMKTLSLLALLLSVLLPLTGCASGTSTTAQPPGETFTGQVWNWDERENTVTLLRGAETVRIKTTPDQIRGLRLHDRATIRGTIAPPADLVTTVTPAAPMRPVPRGPVDQQTVTGTVTAVDPSGRLSINSDRGPLHVWVASGANQRFATGDKVQVTMAAQAVDMVPVAGAGASAAPADPAASSQPGDSAVVTGRVIGVDRGLLVVESPTGPVQVWVGDAPRYAVRQSVQVRTHVAKSP